MEPTLCDGDVLAFHKPDGEYERWQLVLLRFHLSDPRAGERHFAKRVVGLPGEEIEAIDGTLFIDGEVLEGDVYSTNNQTYSFPPLHIPEGRFFVLGDNRRDSFDSHIWASTAAPNLSPADAATVPAENIIGELPADTKKC